ncbi:hypothetical protein T265_02385 [Opisthorchis viverrini]|uniref:Uncharacterized protein n=1 Tax=Opisthorchis viverrini TaxID=6198 RepID=A0A075AIB2_OPIVI|nr:hypothetical protein T265_02385 [Opisthorchis viverrini]KER31329.1 hypothetical protein T265_02385 [Opisthorchis viverrini]
MKRWIMESDSTSGVKRWIMESDSTTLFHSGVAIKLLQYYRFRHSWEERPNISASCGLCEAIQEWENFGTNRNVEARAAVAGHPAVSEEYTPSIFCRSLPSVRGPAVIINAHGRRLLDWHLITKLGEKFKNRDAVLPLSCYISGKEVIGKPISAARDPVRMFELLYTLITGTLTPYERKKASDAELVRAVWKVRALNSTLSAEMLR